MKRFLLFFTIFTLELTKSFSQTTLINPTGAGGFELGNGFAANGWTVVNGAQTNKWFCLAPGNPAVPFAGVNCAYVSNQAAGTTYNYDNTSASVVHFYRDVAIPAGQNNITLSFEWKGQGEGSFDYIQVFLVPNTTVPVAGTLIGTGQIGGNLNLTSTWQLATFTINCGAYAGTTQRLIFSWINDASLGTEPPGAIDNISLVSNGGTVCTYSEGTIPFAPVLPYNAGTAIAGLPDDGFSGVIPIGFTFCYFGVNYTQVVVSSNDYITFDLTQAGLFSNWIINGPVPANTPPEALVSIMCPWVDIDPPVNGASMYYKTLGVTPNRRFIVSWPNVPMFDCNAEIFTGQVILYETTNVIENHVANLPNCATWNPGPGLAVQALNNGCTSVPVPGRNATVYTLSNNAVRYTPTCCTNVLPVELTSFKAKYNDAEKNVDINWTTASETNCDYFVVEKSRDGLIFKEIGKVKGAGNSVSSRYYSSVDPSPDKGVQYYRVKEVDFDGLETLSNTEEVSVSDNMNSVMIVPNPAHGHFDIFFPGTADETCVLEIYNVLGKQVLSETVSTKAGMNKIPLDASSFKKGVYHIVLITGNTTKSGKLVID